MPPEHSLGYSGILGFKIFIGSLRLRKLDFYDQMTAMERSISPYEERGSEASMADSLGIKDAAKESSKGQTQMKIERKKIDGKLRGSYFWEP